MIAKFISCVLMDEIATDYFTSTIIAFQRGASERVTDHVLIGTSGTTLDWIMKFKVFDPKMINMFVLDEADVMIDTQGQQDQTIRIHKYVTLSLSFGFYY